MRLTNTLQNLFSVPLLYMTHKTRGIVLRTVKYGETSLVVTMFTELFGIQTYMVNGVRSNGKTQNKAALLQPAAICDMLVYHNSQKAMQRIKEIKWGVLYKDIFGHIIKNSVALYMVELLHKCLKQPEPNTDLYHFCEDALLALDGADKTVTANFALFFSLQLPHFFGFRPQPVLMDGEAVSETAAIYFDLREGCFDVQQPVHPHFIEGAAAQATAQLLKVMHPAELSDFALHHTLRRQLLLAYQDFFALHLHEFGQLKTLQVMQTVLS
jgi:DNA repair protein RecO (recombination protein O)